MSGRRLADFLALASATRNILRRHVDIQLHNVQRSAATSSITKAIKRDVRGPPASASQFTRTASSTAKPEGHEDSLIEGKDEDVFYERSESHSADAGSTEGGLKVNQVDDSVIEHDKKEYKPASAPAKKSSKTTNPIQDQHVRKYSTHRPIPSETADDTNETSDLRKGIDEEVYYDTKATTRRNDDVEPDHIPREPALPPTPHDKLHDGINSEYYYEREADPEDKPSKPTKSVPSPHPTL